jgi:hypothetical protein
MVEGRWRFNGAPIVIDADGALIDGQHRLEALAATDVKLPFLVVVGVDPVVFETIDDGAKRSVADVLGIEGRKNTALLASVANGMLRYERTGSFANAPHLGITKQDQIKWVSEGDNYQRFITMTAPAQRIHKVIRLNQTAQIACSLLFIERYGVDVVARLMDFWDRVESGMSDERKVGDPAMTLRNFAVAQHTTMRRGSVRLDVWVVAICRSAYRRARWLVVEAAQGSHAGRHA